MNACQLFRELAIESHERIRLAQLEYHLKIFETTVTQNILFALRFWAMQRRYRVEVYAFDATNEPVNGDDLELYIESDNGRFESFAVQCKLGNTKRRFAGFSGGHGIPQCESLLAYSAANDLTPLYLFYAHIADINAGDTFYATVTGTNLSPKELYGCSYAPALSIRQLLTTRRIPAVGEVIGAYSLPWHLLVCRDTDFGHGLEDVCTKELAEIHETHNLRAVNLFAAEAGPQRIPPPAMAALDGDSGKRKFRPALRIIIRTREG